MTDDIDEAMPTLAVPEAHDEMVALLGGVTISQAAFFLTLRLERDGHRLSATDGVLSVTDGARLTDEDRTQIRARKAELLTIVQYLAELP